MAAEDAVFDYEDSEGDYSEEGEEEEEEEEEEEGDLDDTDLDDDTDASAPTSSQPPPPPSSTPIPAPPNPNPNPNPNPSTPLTPQNGAIQIIPLASTAPELKIEERRALVPFDDSRRLFQRLWTDDEEIKILKGFLEFTTQRGTTFASHQYDTGPFYEQIKRELQLDFAKNQLIEKLRRLKKKFRNAAARFAAGKEFVFKSPHDKETFEISRKIWSAGLKRGRDSDEDEFATPNTASATFDPSSANTEGTVRPRFSRSRRRNRRRMEETAVEVPVVGVAVEDPAKAILVRPSPGAIPSVVEETMKSCLAPLFKELLNSVTGAPSGQGLSFGGLALNSLLPLGSGGSLVDLPVGTGGVADEKWRKQQILELEVYSKRIELLQDQIKSTLEELKSTSTAPLS